MGSNALRLFIMSLETVGGVYIPVYWILLRCDTTRDEDFCLYNFWIWAGPQCCHGTDVEWKKTLCLIVTGYDLELHSACYTLCYVYALLWVHHTQEGPLLSHTFTHTHTSFMQVCSVMRVCSVMQLCYVISSFCLWEPLSFYVTSRNWSLGCLDQGMRVLGPFSSSTVSCPLCLFLNVTEVKLQMNVSCPPNVFLNRRTWVLCVCEADTGHRIDFEHFPLSLSNTYKIGPDKKGRPCSFLSPFWPDCQSLLKLPASEKKSLGGVFQKVSSWHWLMVKNKTVHLNKQ